MKTTLFLLLLLIIIGVASYDTWANLYYMVVVETEENPFAQDILREHGLPTLIAMKQFGTAIIASFLCLLYAKHEKMALTISSGVALFQLWLFWYITWAQ